MITHFRGRLLVSVVIDVVVDVKVARRYTLYIDMAAKQTQYSSIEARKIIAEYIDQSALRLAQRLKKEYSAQKKQTAKVRSYA